MKMAAAMILMDLLKVEEEGEIMRENSETMKTLRNTIDPFDLTDRQFVKVFRLSKDAVRYLCDVLQCSLQRRRRGLSVETQIFTALRFFATGSYQKAVGNDYLVSVSQSAVSRAIKAVAVSITQLLAHEWIKFPRTKTNSFKKKIPRRKKF
ncbi:uncharacterized protein LOC112454808 [Temnothorax curvispinosus]|uniref:Uncharacterized protein LOC112454808 n=1 Tax=Temnothorax curvispinosus TaxID=300111 RepID=A0A6J1PR12_9HYME|nr:uncharacterized protein LOC112454808 [Temnothorax curvispinosus]